MDLDLFANELAHDFVTSQGSRPSGAANYPKRPEVIARIQGSINSAALAVRVHSILEAQPGNGELWAGTLLRMLDKQPSLESLKPEIIEVLTDAAYVLNMFQDTRAARDVRPRVVSLLDAVKAS